MTRKYPSHVLGHLLTPLTRFTRAEGVPFAIDNGAFSSFDGAAFRSLIERENAHHDNCLFIVCPDVVANARRTLEIFKYRHRWIRCNWKVALVAQDGQEDLPVPWEEIDALFIGGSTAWKESTHAVDLCKTARILGKHVHVGRVNTLPRFAKFAPYADTCDGSGVSRYDHMIEQIVAGECLPLFQGVCEECDA